MFPSVALGVFLGTVGAEPWFPPLPVEVVVQKLRPSRAGDTGEWPPREKGPGYLIDAGPRAYPALHLLLTDEWVRPFERKAAALRVLQGQPHDRSRFVPVCLTLLKSESWAERQYSLELLAETGGPEHVEAVFPLLYQKDVHGRPAALRALVALGDERHTAVLSQFLANPPKDVLPGIDFYVEVEAGVAALSKKPAPKAKAPKK